MINLFSDFFTLVLYQPLLNGLVALYHIFGDNFGLAIIAITVIVKVVTYPLTKPSMEMAKKQKEIAPELRKLKEKYKDDKQLFLKKQMELYKEHGINPASGCLPQIVQIVILIFLYRVFTDLLQANGLLSEQVVKYIYDFEFLKFAEGESLNTQFLIYNLASVDKTYTLPILSAVAQFVMSKMMMASNKGTEKIVKSTPDTTDDLMYNMQESMTYTFPIMTLFIGISLPAGLSLYWLVSTILGIVQYIIINKYSVRKLLNLKGLENGLRQITAKNK